MKVGIHTQPLSRTTAVGTNSTNISRRGDHPRERAGSLNVCSDSEDWKTRSQGPRATWSISSFTSFRDGLRPNRHRVPQGLNRLPSVVPDTVNFDRPRWSEREGGYTHFCPFPCWGQEHTRLQAPKKDWKGCRVCPQCFSLYFGKRHRQSTPGLHAVRARVRYKREKSGSHQTRTKQPTVVQQQKFAAAISQRYFSMQLP